MAAKPAPKNKPPASRKNRDTERLYKPGQLSRWFAVSSILLLVSWVMLFWKDYDRAWKDYQGDFYDKMIEIEEAVLQREVRPQYVDSGKRAEHFAALQAVEAAAWKKLQAPETQATLERLREEYAEAELEAAAHDRLLKDAKGILSVKEYLYEEAVFDLHEIQDIIAARAANDGAADALPARDEDDVEAARARVDAAQDAMNRLAYTRFMEEVKVQDLLAKMDSIEREIASIEAEWREAKRVRAGFEEDLTKQEEKVATLKHRYQETSWRNAPFIDFLSPTIKVRQIVLDHIHDEWNFATNKKVDRCITCHVGIDVPIFGNEEKLRALGFGLPGELDEDGNPKPELPASWMKPHSHLDLLIGPNSPHVKEDIGCSVCHHGVGWSTDFARAAHRPDNPEEKARWKEEHDWYKAKYIDYPMFPLEYVQGQCFKCHKEGMYWPVAYEERLDHGYIRENMVEGVFGQRLHDDSEHPLYRVASPDNPLLAPEDVRGIYTLPAAPKPYDSPPPRIAASMDLPANPAEALREKLYERYMQEEGLVDALSPVGFDGNLDYEKGEEIVLALIDEMVKGYSWEAPGYTKGYDTFTRYGCMGCHKVKDAGEQVGYEKPPRVGPDLTFIQDKSSLAWIENWIRHPDLYRPDTTMPSFYYFALKDDKFDLAEDGEGNPVVVNVLDAHRTDPSGRFRELDRISTPEDRIRQDVEIKSMAVYLANMQDPNGHRYTRDPSVIPAGEDKNPFGDDLYASLPQGGDAEKGRALVNSLGCAACHQLPEYERGGEFVTDSLERFDYEPPLYRGPRLTNLGSKISNPKWLYAWLANPRHYTDYTRMPNMRINERVEEDQIPHIVEYLLSFRDEHFDALPTIQLGARHKELLEEMWYEIYKKNPDSTDRDPSEIEGEFRNMPLGTVLYRLGENRMAANGCFGCHQVRGHEDDMPIGVELSKEGNKDIHQFDFGRVPKYVDMEIQEPVLDEDGQPVLAEDGTPVMEATWQTVPLVGHTRHEFIRTKITYPRVWEYEQKLRWTDRLRMPRFNLKMDDHYDPTVDGLPTRAAVTGFVVGQLDEPIFHEAIFHPDEYEKDIIAGRKVIERYGCNNCHTVEGEMGYLWGLKSGNLWWQQVKPELKEGQEPATLPPNLFAQGQRTKSDWLVSFLQDPYFLRPIVEVHMPNFGLNDEEAAALARYFVRLGGRDQDLIMPEPGSTIASVEYAEIAGTSFPAEGVLIQGPNPQNANELIEYGRVSNAEQEAELLFEVHKCNSCHLPSGTPGASPTDGGVAPSLRWAGDRLRHRWLRFMLNDPSHLIDGTKMIAYNAMGREGRTLLPEAPEFQFHLRWNEDWQQAMADPERRADALHLLAEVQLDALAEYVLYHYEPPEGEPVMSWPRVRESGRGGVRDGARLPPAPADPEDGN